MIQKKALISAFCYALEKTKKNSWTKIPEFMEALANKLNEAPEPDFGTWRLTHKGEYMELIKAFE